MGRTPRRWLSLSLRGSLVLVLLFGLWLGWQAHLARKQREAVAAVKEYGGFVRYDWELDGNGMPVPGATPRAPGWLRRAVGEDYFQRVAVVDMIHATDRKEKADLTESESDALMTKLAGPATRGGDGAPAPRTSPAGPTGSRARRRGRAR
jgi:hypothetical protein